MEWYKFVADVQKAFFEAGWLWQEQVFDNGDAIICFTLSKNPHVFTNPHLCDEKRYGWGRFARDDAWNMAKLFLLDEIGNPTDIAYLRDYKARYG